LHPPHRAGSRVLYISVPSFIFSGPDYTVKDRYSGGKTNRKIFFSRKKKPKEKIYRKKKRIYFSIFSLELYIPAEYFYRRRQVEKITCSILLNRCDTTGVGTKCTLWAFGWMN